MKRALILLSLVLFASLCLGCEQDQFAIERQYYWAQKSAQKIYKNPHATPPNELQRVVGIFKQFSDKYVNSYLAIDAEFSACRLYMVKDEQDTARAELQKIITKYSKYEPICAEALFLTGNTYEMQDDWDLAMTQYKKIMQAYPLTNRGLEAPLYITRHYQVNYQPDRMKDAGQQAVSHYQGLSLRYADKPAAVIRAESLVVETYVLLKEWQPAAAAMSSMIEKYKVKAPMDTAMMNLALLYNRQLKDTPKAKETLEELIREYPKSRLNQTAQQILKKLGG